MNYNAGKIANDLHKELISITDRLLELQYSVGDGEASDGLHTFNELYEYRMLYNAHAAHGWLADGINVVKSVRHSDGEYCFGPNSGYFIVVAELPTGQVSNHYKIDDAWDLFHVPEVDLPPEYDGHTPKMVAQRLREYLTKRKF